jgi:tRNA/tmRNA/rRNA uracil-C5-methylase (TrmA/RlmC/RlmD family)
VTTAVRGERFFGRGAVIARSLADGSPCVVERLLPGEVATVAIERPGYLPHARLVTVDVPSTHRVESPCPHYEQCDGCALLHADTDGEAEHAAATVREVMERHAPSVVLPPSVEVLPIPPFEGHRHRSRMGVSTDNGRVRIGLRDRDGIANDIPDCPALAAPLRAAALTASRAIACTDVGPYAALELAGDGGRVVVVPADIGASSVAALARAGLELAAPTPDAWQSPSPEGSRAVRDWVCGLGVHGNAAIFDATAGSGDLASALAGECASMLLGDIDFAALRIATARVGAAGCPHVETRAGKVETIATRLAREQASFDLVLVNPMRKSLGERSMRALARLSRRYMLYLGPAPRAAAPDLAVAAEEGLVVRRLAACVWYPRSGRTMLCALLERP